MRSPITIDVDVLRRQITDEVRESLTREIVGSIIDVLSRNFLGQGVGNETGRVDAVDTRAIPQGAREAPPRIKNAAADAIGRIRSFVPRQDKHENAVLQVKLGSTGAEGGSRGKALMIGGATCMPFHLWEGSLPHRPLIAMEVFDAVSEKYPAVLRDTYGDLLKDPAAMARTCVRDYGADLISVRLDGTHPERGNRNAGQSVALVESVLKAVDVPLIITGHNHFEKNNEILKAVAQACEGENLLLNWVEQNNYRTIAGAALAYGHTLVAQSPIDVNIGKQLNILLRNMGIKPDRIVMDPMTGAIGYGVEYTYSVMERIRLTGLGGDAMICSPMIVSPGYECARMKEYRANEESFPMWGKLESRAAYWELATAVSFLYAGADLLIMYHPEAALALKRAIFDLLDGTDGAAKGQA